MRQCSISTMYRLSVEMQTSGVEIKITEPKQTKFFNGVFLSCILDFSHDIDNALEQANK